MSKRTWILLALILISISGGTAAFLAQRRPAASTITQDACSTPEPAGKNYKGEIFVQPKIITQLPADITVKFYPISSFTNSVENINLLYPRYNLGDYNFFTQKYIIDPTTSTISGTLHLDDYINGWSLFPRGWIKVNIGGYMSSETWFCVQSLQQKPVALIVTKDSPDPVFVGGDVKEAKFTATTTEDANLTFTDGPSIVPDLGGGQSPYQLKKDEPYKFKVIDLIAGSTKVSALATNNISNASADVMVNAYGLKVSEPDKLNIPTEKDGKTTAEIGIDGWDKVAGDQKTAFQDYFKGRVFTATIYDKDDKEVPGFVFSPAGENVPLPIDTVNFQQPLEIRRTIEAPPENGPFKLRLAVSEAKPLAKVDATQDFPMKVAESQFDLSIFNTSPIKAITVDDEHIGFDNDDESVPAENQPAKPQVQLQLPGISVAHAQDNAGTQVKYLVPGQSYDLKYSWNIPDAGDYKLIATLPSYYKLLIPKDADPKKYFQADEVGDAQSDSGIALIWNHSANDAEIVERTLSISLPFTASMHAKFDTEQAKQAANAELPSPTDLGYEKDFEEAMHAKDFMFDIELKTQKKEAETEAYRDEAKKILQTEVDLISTPVVSIKKIRRLVDGKDAPDIDINERNNPEEYNKLYPGDRLLYKIDFSNPSYFSRTVKNVTLQLQFSDQALAILDTQFDEMESEPQSPRKVKDNVLEWDIESVKPEEVVSVLAEVLVNDHVKATYDTIGAIPSVFIGSPQNRVEGEILKRDLYHQISGTVLSMYGRGVPYTNIMVNNLLSFTKESLDTKFEEGSLVQTDKDGKYQLDVPRKFLAYTQEEAKIAEAAEKEVQMDLIIQLQNDERDTIIDPETELTTHPINYSYKYAFDENTDSFKSTTLEFPVPSGKDAKVDIDFRDSKYQDLLKSKKLGNDQTLLDRVIGGTEIMRALGLAKRYIEDNGESLIAHLNDSKKTKVLQNFTVQALKTTDQMQQICGSSRAAACSIPLQMWIGPEGWTPRDTKYWSNETFYHEWTHHVYASTLTLEESQATDNPSVPLNIVNPASGLLPKIPDAFIDPQNTIKPPDPRINIDHRSYFSDGSQLGVNEGLADFSGVFFDRKFDGRTNWQIANSTPNNIDSSGDISLPLPIFSGLINSPRTLPGNREDAAPIVYDNESEETSVKTFLKAIVTNDSHFNTTHAWWAGTTDSKLKPIPSVGSELEVTPLGGTEDENYISIFQSLQLGGYVSFPDLIKQVAHLADASSPASNVAAPYMRLFGLFGDYDCDWTYDESESLEIGGSFCPSLSLDTYYSNSSKLVADPDIVNTSRSLSPRPWRTNAKPLSTVPTTAANVEVKMSDGGTHDVVIRHILPEEYKREPLEEKYQVVGQGVVPIFMYPPVMLSRVTISVDGSSTAPIVLESSNVWLAIAGEAPSPITASKTFTIDGGQATVLNVPVLRISEQVSETVMPGKDDVQATITVSKQIINQPGSSIIVAGSSAETNTKVTTKSGEILLVTTSDLKPGEQVDVSIDNKIVAKKQTIPAEGAKLSILVPTGIDAGEHEVRLTRSNGQVASAKFKTAIPSKLWVYLGLSILLIIVGYVAYRIRRRKPQLPPPIPPVAATTAFCIGIVMLGMATTSLVRAASPAIVNFGIGNSYIGPGSETSATFVWGNPLYRRNAPLDMSWMGLGYASLVPRIAGDWKQIYPDEELVFLGSGIKGGGLPTGPEYQDGFHDEGRAFHITSHDSAGKTHILTDKQLLPDYDVKKVVRLAKLIQCLTNNQARIITAAQDPVPTEITFDPEDKEWWHIDLPVDFQGPPVFNGCAAEVKAANP